MPREIIRYGGRVGEKMNAPILDGPPAAVIRYSRATVGATYHVEPAPEPFKHVEARPPRQRYDNSSPMLGPEAIRQIVEALESLDWVVWVKEQMANQHGNNSSVAQPLAPADRDEAPREKYARDRMKAQQLRRGLRKVAPTDPDYREHYNQAAQADRQYRESREAIANRIAERALRDGVSYDRARELLGEQLPMPLLGPPV